MQDHVGADGVKEPEVAATAPAAEKPAQVAGGAAISAKVVKELRDKSGAGMMACKKALTEAAGNFDKVRKRYSFGNLWGLPWLITQLSTCASRDGPCCAVLSDRGLGLFSWHSCSLRSHAMHTGNHLLRLVHKIWRNRVGLQLPKSAQACYCGHTLF